MKLRVLIADDSPFVREILREGLEGTGDVEVIGEAGDGLAAIKMANPGLTVIVTFSDFPNVPDCEDLGDPLEGAGLDEVHLDLAGIMFELP